MGKFRIELRERGTFDLLEILDREYVDLSWAYSRIGGCGEFEFLLPRKLFEEQSISGDFNIRIYYRNPATDSFDLWYQGLIENKVPNIAGNSENVAVSGHGYVVQLSRIYLDDVSYSSQEASVIVKDLLDNYITPNTDITYNAPDIEATTFTFDSLDFNTDALSALRTIADTVGTREWGVDQDRNFFFKERSSTVGRRYSLGNNITNFNENQDFKDIINRVIVQGKQTGGTYYKATYNDEVSQLKYGIRAEVIQNSAVSTADVSKQLADAIFAEKNDVIRKASCELVGLEAQIEATNPIDLMNVLGKEIKYGEKKYGTFLYSGNVDRVIDRINYMVTESGALRTYLDMGEQKPTISEAIQQLVFNLDQQRSAAL